MDSRTSTRSFPTWPPSCPPKTAPLEGGPFVTIAGGKTAVLWGTCVDNLLSFEMAMPDELRDHSLSLLRTDPDVQLRGGVADQLFPGLDPVGKRVRIFGQPFDVSQLRPGLRVLVIRQANRPAEVVQVEGRG